MSFLSRIGMRSYFCAAFLAVAGLMGGCAALRVDVDVYKGPLANSDEVQVRQYAALAVAAKPLLALVRNKLEAAQNGKFAQQISLRGNEKYRDAWVPENRFQFSSESARFINGALSMYEDAGDAEAAKMAERALAAWDSVDRAYPPLQFDSEDEKIAAMLRKITCDFSGCQDSLKDGPDARAAWNTFRKAYIAFFVGCGVAGTSARNECSDIASELSPGFPEAAKSLELLQDGFRWTLALHAACQQLKGFLKPASLMVSQRENRGATDLCAADPSANSVFAHLMSRSIVERHSQLLFGKAGTPFARRVPQIADAFSASRDGMRKLWLANVDMLAQLGRNPSSHAALSNVARAVADTVQPRSLACSLSLSTGLRDGMSAPLKAALKGYQSRLLDADVVWTFVDPPKQGRLYNAANAAIVSAAEGFPTEFARLLRAVDTAFPIFDAPQASAKFCSALGEFDAQQLASPGARTFGLARGPTLGPNFGETLKSLNDSLRGIADGTASGFERARPALGIESLTSRLLGAFDEASGAANPNRKQEERNGSPSVDEASGAANPNRNQAGRNGSPSVNLAQAQLDEMLIAFSERLLFVTNNRALLDAVKKSDANTTGTEGASAERATAVLQAVGNTLVVQANDLRQRKAHENRLAGRASSESAASRLAFGLSPAQTLDNVLREVNATIERMDIDAQKLKSEQDRRTNAGGPDSAKLAKRETEAKAADQAASELAAESKSALSAARAAYLAFSLVEANPKPLWQVENPAGVSETQRKSVFSVLSAFAKTNTKASQQDLTAQLRHQVNLLLVQSIGELAKSEVAAVRDYLDTNEKTLAASLSKPDGPLEGFKKKISDDYKKKHDANLAAKLAADHAAANARAVKSLLLSEQKSSPAIVQQEIAKLAASSAELRGAQQVLREIKGAILIRLDEAKISEPAAVLAALKTEVAGRVENKSTSAADLPKYKALHSALLDTLAPPAFNFQVAPEKLVGQRANQRDVLDDVIAILRQQRLQAAATGQTGRAEHLDKALVLAYEQRAGMAYLRPASSYLRSAFSATALQSNYDTKWVNMLRANSARALFGEQPDELDKARADIDKQFWQTINSVSVAGGGATNYVLAKDDVGNWYVKAYEADPESVILSAQSLALFNSGKKFDLDLLQRANLQRQFNSAKDPDAKAAIKGELDELTKGKGRGGAAGTTALQSVKDKYESDYKTQTREDVDALKNAILKLREDINSAWQSQLTSSVKQEMATKLSETYLPPDGAAESKAAVKLLEDSLVQQAGNPATDLTSRQSSAIVDALRLAQQMRNRLYFSILRDESMVEAVRGRRTTESGELAVERAELARLKKAASEVAGDAAEKAKADGLVNVATGREAAASVKLASTDAELVKATTDRSTAAQIVVLKVRAMTSSFAGRRIDAIGQYESALSIVGEVAGSK